MLILDFSALGNPYSHNYASTAQYKTATSSEAIVKYRPYFRTTVGTIQASDKLLEICKTNELVLIVCWCAPQPCHGDVVKEWLEGQMQ